MTMVTTPAVIIQDILVVFVSAVVRHGSTRSSPATSIHVPYSLGYNEVAWTKRSELAFEEGLKKIGIFSCVRGGLNNS